MATTAPDKIPDTIVSRAQVFEFKTIASRLIGEQLRKIAEADGLSVSGEAIALVARVGGRQHARCRNRLRSRSLRLPARR